MKIKPTPIRSWLVNFLAGRMNWASELFPNVPPDRITIRDHIRWKIEAILSFFYHLAFTGSADELIMAEGGEIAPKYWNERQKQAVPDLATRDAWCFSGPNCWEGLYGACLPSHTCPRCGKDTVTLH